MVVVEDITERKIFEQTLLDALAACGGSEPSKDRFLGT